MISECQYLETKSAADNGVKRKWSGTCVKMLLGVVLYHETKSKKSKNGGWRRTNGLRLYVYGITIRIGLDGVESNDLL